MGREIERELKLCKTKDSLRRSMSLSFKYWVSLVFKGRIKERERERERERDKDTERVYVCGG